MPSTRFDPLNIKSKCPALISVRDGTLIAELECRLEEGEPLIAWRMTASRERPLLIYVNLRVIDGRIGFGVASDGLERIPIVELSGRPSAGPESHMLWIAPRDSEFLLVACALEAGSVRVEFSEIKVCSIEESERLAGDVFHSNSTIGYIGDSSASFAPGEVNLSYSSLTLPKEGLEVLPRMLCGEWVREQDGSMIVEPVAPDRHALWGPYLNFAPGQYEAVIKGHCSGPSNETCMRLEILVSPDDIIASVEYSSLDLNGGKAFVIFRVPDEVSARLETRITQLGDHQLNLASVRVIALG